MTDKSIKLVEDALALSEEERAEVVEQLLNSFDTEDEEAIDEAWRAEVIRRSQEIESGSVEPLSWSEVKELAYQRTYRNA